MLAVGLLCGSHSASAQYRYKVRHYNREGRPYYQGPLRVALAGGTAFYDGDLGNSLRDDFLGPAVGVGVRYRLTPRLHLGSDFVYFKMGARDHSTNRGTAVSGLAFTSSNASGTVFLRVDLLADPSVFAASQADSPPLQVYVQGGAGLVLYNPHAYIGTSRATGSTVFLAPERNDYPALAGVAPIGIGFSARLADRLNAGVEATYYFTTTGRLDDIDARLQKPKPSHDAFATLLLKVDYALHLP